MARDARLVRRERLDWVAFSGRSALSFEGLGLSWKPAKRLQSDGQVHGIVTRNC
jgi:hypothetical protein